eukprot:TRINITY_DN15163_c0_g1_i1.p1 TRINITY_DN15163_c0_g1~~TRINITY_DN15163_c0_g1_i1.p1  ORF type:complete len:342 (+),score=45.88 TRINITY_DN15163_c0_g1_i1:57-1082(+)
MYWCLGWNEDTDAPSFHRSSQPGTIGNLTDEEEAAYNELEALLAAEPELEIRPHRQELRKKRLLRYLRAEVFDAERAATRIRETSLWWLEFGMDDCVPSDEIDEKGALYVCGEDTRGCPTLVAFPRKHFSSSTEETLAKARRVIYTSQRCFERFPKGSEATCVIYDAKGATMANWDYLFARTVICIMNQHFPERLNMVYVLNSNWAIRQLWNAISFLVDAVTRSKVRFYGTDFDEDLLAILPKDHPYLLYAQQVRDLSDDEAEALALPPATPYVARWPEALAADTLDELARPLTKAPRGAKFEDVGPRNVSRPASIQSSLLRRLASWCCCRCSRSKDTIPT